MELDEHQRMLLREPNLAFLATVPPDGTPHVTPVWVDEQDGKAVVNTADGRAKGVTEQGLVQSAGPNVQLASTSLQGQPVRRWRRGHALAGAPMGNSWLRGRLDGNVSVSGCGEPIPPSTLPSGA